jgi:hypothetical protein
MKKNGNQLAEKKYPPARNCIDNDDYFGIIRFEIPHHRRLE